MSNNHRLLFKTDGHACRKTRTQCDSHVVRT